MRRWYGVVEGFYGRPWEQAQRLELMDRLAASGLDTYFYAPKDDLAHRARWRDLYAGQELARLTELAAAARERGLSFLYGLAPGLDIRYADPGDRARLLEKLRQVRDLGVAGLALLFDDIPGELAADDLRRFGSLAGAQASLVHEALALERPLFVCPTQYCGTMRRGDYLEALARALPPEVELFWTGPTIISPTIDVAHARETAALLGRRPLIWDNLFANDYDMRRLYTGPYDGRPAALRDEVAGVLLNPNCEHEANAVPLHTFARWLGVRDEWDPRRAWLEATAAWHARWETAGAPISLDDLRRFCDCFYLPAGSGESARRWWDDLTRLAREPVERWGASEARFLEAAEQLMSFCDRATALRRRALLHAIYRHAWELKEELYLLREWVRWRKANPTSGEPFSHRHLRPPTYRGALLTQLRSVLAMDADGGLRPGARP